MTARLLLLRHGTTAAVRAAAFPLDEGLDERGTAEARALVPHLPSQAELRRSPARRGAETAAALGHPDATVDPGLRETDFGDWSGRTLADLHAEDAEPVVAWMTDPAFAPPNGESLEQLCVRVGAWMDEHAGDEQPLVAVTHGGVIRAAISVALGAPPSAAWRIDVSPGSLTELHAHDGRWRLVRANWTPSRQELRDARAAVKAGATGAQAAATGAEATATAGPSAGAGIDAAASGTPAPSTGTSSSSEPA